MALRAVVIALLAVFVFLYPLNRPDDPDVWFHLAAGRHISQQGEVPSMGTFLHSYPADGARHSHEWLFQLLLYRLHEAAGMEGLVVAKAVVIALSFLLLFFTSAGGRRFYLAAALLLAAYAAGSGRFYIRPEVAGGLFFALQWMIISKAPRRWSPAAFLVLQVVWTNMHWSSILGVALAGAFAAAGAAGRFLPLPRGWKILPPGATWQGQVLLFGGTALATLVNPDGFQPFIEPLRYLGAGGFALPVAEVWPMHWVFFREGAGVTFHHWFFATAAVTFLLFALNFRRLNLAHLFTFAGLFLLGMLAERHALFFALLAVPVALGNLNSSAERPPGRPAGEISMALVLLFVLTTLTMNRITGVSFLLPYPRPYEPLSLAASPLLWPHRAAQLVTDEKLPDAIFNDFNSGNYLNWAIYPRKVYINGTFSDLQTSRDYARLRSRPGEWDTFADERGIETAFFRLAPLIATPGLVGSILANKDWTLVFYDGVGAVFIRNTGPHAALAGRLSVDLAGELHDAVREASAREASPETEGLPLLGEIARYRRSRDLARLFRLRGRFYLLAGREDLATIAAEIVSGLQH